MINTGALIYFRAMPKQIWQEGAASPPRLTNARQFVCVRPPTPKLIETLSWFFTECPNICSPPRRLRPPPVPENTININFSEGQVFMGPFCLRWKADSERVRVSRIRIKFWNISVAVFPAQEFIPAINSFNYFFMAKNYISGPGKKRGINKETIN